MRPLQINLKPFYAKHLLEMKYEVDEQGFPLADQVPVYGPLTGYCGRIAPASLNAQETIGGIEVHFDLRILLYDTEAPFQEDSLIWVSDHVAENAPPTHVIKRVERDLNVTVLYLDDVRNGVQV